MFIFVILYSSGGAVPLYDVSNHFIRIQQITWCGLSYNNF